MNSEARSQKFGALGALAVSGGDGGALYGTQPQVSPPCRALFICALGSP